MSSLQHDNEMIPSSPSPDNLTNIVKTFTPTPDNISKLLHALETYVQPQSTPPPPLPPVLVDVDLPSIIIQLLNSHHPFDLAPVVNDVIRMSCLLFWKRLDNDCVGTSTKTLDALTLGVSPTCSFYALHGRLPPASVHSLKRHAPSGTVNGDGGDTTDDDGENLLLSVKELEEITVGSVLWFRQENEDAPVSWVVARVDELSPTGTEIRVTTLEDDPMTQAPRNLWLSANYGTLSRGPIGTAHNVNNGDILIEPVVEQHYSRDELAWRQTQLECGSLLDAETTSGVWLQACVVQASSLDDTLPLTVTFLGLPSSHDIVVSRQSSQLARLNTKSLGRRGHLGSYSLMLAADVDELFFSSIPPDVEKSDNNNDDLSETMARPASSVLSTFLINNDEYWSQHVDLVQCLAKCVCNPSPHLLAIFVQLASQLSLVATDKFARKLAQAILPIVTRTVQSFTPDLTRRLTAHDVTKLLASSFRIMRRCVPRSQANQMVDRLRLELSRKRLLCPALEQRVQGLKQFLELYNETATQGDGVVVSADGGYEPVRVSRITTCEEMASEAMKQRWFSDAFAGETAHVEMMKRAQPLAQVLLMHGCFTERDMDALWTAVLSEESCQDALGTLVFVATRDTIQGNVLVHKLQQYVEHHVKQSNVPTGIWALLGELASNNYSSDVSAGSITILWSVFECDVMARKALESALMSQGPNDTTKFAIMQQCVVVKQLQPTYAKLLWCTLQSFPAIASAHGGGNGDDDHDGNARPIRAEVVEWLCRDDNESSPALVRRLKAMMLSNVSAREMLDSCFDLAHQLIACAKGGTITELVQLATMQELWVHFTTSSPNVDQHAFMQWVHKLTAHLRVNPNESDIVTDDVVCFIFERFSPCMRLTPPQWKIFVTVFMVMNHRAGRLSYEANSYNLIEEDLLGVDVMWSLAFDEAGSGDTIAESAASMINFFYRSGTSSSHPNTVPRVMSKTYLLNLQKCLDRLELVITQPGNRTENIARAMAVTRKILEPFGPDITLQVLQSAMQGGCTIHDLRELWHGLSCHAVKKRHWFELERIPVQQRVNPAKAMDFVIDSLCSSDPCFLLRFTLSRKLEVAANDLRIFVGDTELGPLQEARPMSELFFGPQAAREHHVFVLHHGSSPPIASDITSNATIIITPSSIERDLKELQQVLGSLVQVTLRVVSKCNEDNNEDLAAQGWLLIDTLPTWHHISQRVIKMDFSYMEFLSLGPELLYALQCLHFALVARFDDRWLLACLSPGPRPDVWLRSVADGVTSPRTSINKTSPSGFLSAVISANGTHSLSNIFEKLVASKRNGRDPIINMVLNLKGLLGDTEANLQPALFDVCTGVSYSMSTKVICLEAWLSIQHDAVAMFLTQKNNAVLIALIETCSHVAEARLALQSLVLRAPCVNQALDYVTRNNMNNDESFEFCRFLVENLDSKPVERERARTLFTMLLTSCNPLPRGAFRVLQVLFYSSSGEVTSMFIDGFLDIAIPIGFDLSAPETLKKPVFDALLACMHVSRRAVERVANAVITTIPDCSEAIKSYRGGDDRFRIGGGIDPYSDTRHVSGFAGLVNLGSTCFLNSLVQQIFMIPSLCSYFVNLPGKATGAATPTAETDHEPDLLYLFRDVITRMRFSNRRACTLLPWFNAFCGKFADMSEQQDAHEFFNNTCDRLDDRLDPLRIFGKNLGTEVTSTWTQLGTNETRSSPGVVQYTVMLEIPPGGGTLVQALERFTKGTVLEDYRWVDNGPVTRAMTTQHFTQLSDILPIHLKRFVFDLETLVSHKINARLEFPMELDMRPYTREGTNGKEEIRSAEYYQYSLVGIVVHAGETTVGGHYFAHIRARFPGFAGTAKEGEWFTFNDESITPFDVHTQLASSTFGGTTRKGVWRADVKKLVEMEVPVNHSAYMLFYQRTSTLTHKPSVQQQPLIVPPDVAMENHSHELAARLFNPCLCEFISRAAEYPELSEVVVRRFLGGQEAVLGNGPPMLFAPFYEEACKAVQAVMMDDLPDVSLAVVKAVLDSTSMMHEMVIRPLDVRVRTSACNVILVAFSKVDEDCGAAFVHRMLSEIIPQTRGLRHEHSFWLMLRKMFEVLRNETMVQAIIQHNIIYEAMFAAALPGVKLLEVVNNRVVATTSSTDKINGDSHLVADAIHVACRAATAAQSLLTDAAQVVTYMPPLPVWARAMAFVDSNDTRELLCAVLASNCSPSQLGALLVNALCQCVVPDAVQSFFKGVGILGDIIGAEFVHEFFLGANGLIPMLGSKNRMFVWTCILGLLDLFREREMVLFTMRQSKMFWLNSVVDFLRVNQRELGKFAETAYQQLNEFMGEGEDDDEGDEDDEEEDDAVEIDEVGLVVPRGVMTSSRTGKMMAYEEDDDEMDTDLSMSGEPAGRDSMDLSSEE